MSLIPLLCDLCGSTNCEAGRKLPLPGTSSVFNEPLLSLLVRNDLFQVLPHPSDGGGSNIDSNLT